MAWATSMKMVCAASVFLLLGAYVQAAAEALPARNAALLTAFADTLLIQHRTEAAFDSYVSEGLIQHNPAARDGRAAAIALVKPIVTSPGAQFAVSSLVVDGDFAFMHYRGTLGDSGHAAAVAELYRIQNGKFVEHWDAFQPVPTASLSAHPMFGVLPPSLPAPCSNASAQDRAVLSGFADLLYRQKNIHRAFELYAAPDMIQHDPSLPDGREAAIAQLAPILSRPTTHITVAHILACRGLGIIHLRSWNGTNPGHVIFDIMRIDSGRIVEHWDVFQPITGSTVNRRPPV
jgi:predicted SnoaL-like aldol condensation-catalyzing enzyme